MRPKNPDLVEKSSRGNTDFGGVDRSPVRGWFLNSFTYYVLCLLKITNSTLTYLLCNCSSVRGDHVSVPVLRDVWRLWSRAADADSCSVHGCHGETT